MTDRTIRAQIPYLPGVTDPLTHPVQIAQLVTSAGGQDFVSVDPRMDATLIASIPDLDERRSAQTWVQYTKLAPRPGWRVLMIGSGAHGAWPSGDGTDMCTIGVSGSSLLAAGLPPDYPDVTVALVLGSRGLSIMPGEGTVPVDLYFDQPRFTGRGSLYFGQVAARVMSYSPEGHTREIEIDIRNTAFIEGWAQAWLRGEETT